MSTIRNRYAYLILLIQLWDTKIRIVLFLSSLKFDIEKSGIQYLWPWEIHSLGKGKFEYYKSMWGIIKRGEPNFQSSAGGGEGRLKLSEGKNLEGNFEISICKVLVLIKVVSGKNNYFLHQKFELHR